MEDKSEIIEFALAWMAAIVSNDAAAIGNYMADEWIIIGSDGATTKADFLALVASGDLTHDMMRTVGEIRVQFHDATAVYTARVINSGHFRGQSFSADEWVSDVIVRSDAGWKCVLSHVTPASKQDGAGAE